MKTFLEFITESLSHEEAMAALGLSPGYNDDELRDAYRAAALRYHPDRQSGNEEMMRKINAAHDKLKEPRPIANQAQAVSSMVPPEHKETSGLSAQELRNRAWKELRARKRAALLRKAVK